MRNCGRTHSDKFLSEFKLDSSPHRRQNPKQVATPCAHLIKASISAKSAGFCATPTYISVYFLYIVRPVLIRSLPCLHVDTVSAANSSASIRPSELSDLTDWASLPDKFYRFHAFLFASEVQGARPLFQTFNSTQRH